MKVLITDNDNGYVVNYDGSYTEVRSDADELATGMGYDIKEEINKIQADNDEALYGFRIDYTVTPIRTDPFK